MGKIHLLSDTLASQVAAGEVVERPASVVKELVENSIDSGARNIEIRVRRGGISSIAIADDGCGMDKTDALMSLERHATSKIRQPGDLASILTMGFRGEALPSIASVSKFRLTTREANALAGTEILVQGGKLTAVKEAGEAPGTQIEVRSLFYNLPARRKFLRTESTEFSHIEHQVRVHAIAHPTIRFSLLHNERTVFHLPATESLFERVRGLVGNELAGRLLELPEVTREGIGVSGFIGEPGLSRSNRHLQMIFLNRRPIEGAILQYALREGYHTALMKGQQPVTFLFLKMDPGSVDVNVHPAKREVRFHDGNGLRRVLVEVIAETLEQRRGGGSRGEFRGGEGRQDSVVKEAVPSSQLGVSPRAAGYRQEVLLPEAEQRALRRDWSAFLQDSPEAERPHGERSMGSEESRGEREAAGPGGDASSGMTAPALGDREASEGAEGDVGADCRERGGESGDHVTGGGEGEAAARPSDGEGGIPAVGGEEGSAVDGGSERRGSVPRPEDFRVMGVLGKLYVLLESRDGLVLMDQHAAHERVLFEQMRKRMESEGVPTQQLLMPVTLAMTPREFDLVRQHLETLRRLGIGAEVFGTNTLKVDCLPTFVSERDGNRFLNAVLEELQRDSGRMSSVRLGEDMVATTVCRHAVKANDDLHVEELKQLLKDLLDCDLPFCCPHGRPTLVQMSYKELERKFGRVV